VCFDRPHSLVLRDLGACLDPALVCGTCAGRDAQAQLATGALVVRCVGRCPHHGSDGVPDVYLRRLALQGHLDRDALRDLAARRDAAAAARRALEAQPLPDGYVVEGLRSQRCPNCTMVCIRISGCPNVTCRCGHSWRLEG
jgi:hypothetical protein